MVAPVSDHLVSLFLSPYREISKEDIEMPQIKEVGQYVASVKLHPEVVAEVKINVVGK